MGFRRRRLDVQTWNGKRMTDSRIIKKYPNRRLYDTAISSYITLEDVKRLVLEGVAFNDVILRIRERVRLIEFETYVDGVFVTLQRAEDMEGAPPGDGEKVDAEPEATGPLVTSGG